MDGWNIKNEKVLTLRRRKLNRGVVVGQRGREKKSRGETAIISDIENFDVNTICIGGESVVI